MRAFLWMLLTVVCLTVLWGSVLLREPRVPTLAASVLADEAGKPDQVPVTSSAADVPRELVPEQAVKQSPAARLIPEQPLPPRIAAAGSSSRARAARTPTVRTSAPVSVETVAASVRQALGSRSGDGDILIQGTTQIDDSTGKFSLMFNSKGCYLQEVEGPITVAAGFDGHASWALASTAEKGYGGGDIALPESVIEVVTGRWAAVDGPCTLRGEDAVPGTDTFTVCLTPDGGGPSFYVDLDTSTWLPQSVYWDRSGVREAWNLTDYRREMGMLFPHRLDRIRGAETDTFEVTRVSPAPNFPENPYQPAGLRLARIRSQPEETGSVAPMRG